MDMRLGRNCLTHSSAFSIPVSIVPEFEELLKSLIVATNHFVRSIELYVFADKVGVVDLKKQTIDCYFDLYKDKHSRTRLYCLPCIDGTGWTYAKTKSRPGLRKIWSSACVWPVNAKADEMGRGPYEVRGTTNRAFRACCRFGRPIGGQVGAQECNPIH